ncbi:ATP-binding response regulator [Aquabacterium sp.]|uniref:ATP-binding response regulator n=1 Tax=Aquabacterium sp. TaxID=1872578 RepID=UPI0040381756
MSRDSSSVLQLDSALPDMNPSFRDHEHDRDHAALQAELARLQTQLLEQQAQNERLQQRCLEAESGLIAARVCLPDRRLESILDAMPGAVAYWDSGLVLRYCNRRLRQHWRHKSESLVGRHMAELLSPEGFQRTLPFVQAVLQGQETTGEHQESNGLFAQVSFTPDMLDGEVKGFVVLAMDVTELKAAQAVAEQAGKVKNEFLSGVSHEIRTPLNAVLGFAQVGALRYPDHAAATHFGHILQAGQHLLGLINDILDFSRIEAGKLDIHIGEMALNTCIEQALEPVREQARAKGLRLEVLRAPGVPERWRADAQRVGQILGNLLTNAVKFTQQGEVRLVIRADDTGLSLVVQDTGPGMDAQMQSQLFKPFVRGDGSSTRRAGGTGLGLSICKRLVDMMDGRIIVDSTPGLGSRLEVRLPLALLPEPAPQVPPPAEATRWETHGLDGARVLVAEDHRVNQLLLEQLLLSVGVRITMVNNGVEAVDAVKRGGQGAFDLLLCDIEMPLMDGYQATEAILQLDPGLPVLGLTAHAFEEARAKGLRAGMVDYLVKPFVHDELMRLMARHARRVA